MEKIPIYDNHVHLRPEGKNIDALLEFEKAGGTGITLVTLPYDEIQVYDPAALRRSYEVTLSFADRARERTKLNVNVAVGPYPILLMGIAERLKLKRAETIMKRGIDIAADMVSSGRANAIGEIGRPHFDIPIEIKEASDRILMYGLETAAKVDCPVIIHSESGSPELMRELSEMARSASLDPGKVIKHFSPPLVRDDETYGVFPSIPASKKSINEALTKGDRFMLETDYVDDPERPGAVMSINTIPKRVLAMVRNGNMKTETAWKIGHDIPNKMFLR